jgi:hypothetical protein
MSFMSGFHLRFGQRRPAVGGVAPSLPLLEHVRDLRPAEWLQHSMTTFAANVASFLPGHFEAYARLYHPLEHGDGSERSAPTWREAAAAANVDLDERNAGESLSALLPANVHISTGSLPAMVIGRLISHLGPATTTPANCWFAIWEGFGGSLVPGGLEPKLDLPHRRYHVFAGPVEGALTSFGHVPFHHQSSNLWWPADHAWCVATEVDLAWTYVGGSRKCIASLLADPDLETIETTASAFA